MKRQQKGIRSTKQKIETALDTIETRRCMNPPKEREKRNQLFITMGMINKKDGTIYADLRGKFPITSMNGMQSVFIMYDWTTNSILATPIKDAKVGIIVECLKKRS